MAAGAPKNNKNAEEWTIKEATELFNDSLEYSTQKEYDFIGEIARDLGTYRDVYKYLVGKFPELKQIHNRILSNLEANCFSHAKTGKIREATAIVNLKSNYKWTDRIDTTTKDEKINTDLSTQSTDELLKRAEAVKKLNE